jgi:hypothetical protein
MLKINAAYSTVAVGLIWPIAIVPCVVIATDGFDGSDP